MLSTAKSFTLWPRVFLQNRAIEYMIKNIIFDWSGVVKDAAKGQLVLINKIFSVLGHRAITLEEMKDEWEQPHMGFYKKYLPDLTYEEQKSLYTKFILGEETPDSYPGIVELIKRLKKLGKILFVVSTDIPETLLPEIKKYELADVFNEVISNVDDKEPSVRELISKNNFKLEETVFIGDSNCEVEVGKKVGIKTCAVTWVLISEERLRKMSPDFLVTTVNELEKVLL